VPRFSLVLAAFSFVIWIYLTFARGVFWRLHRFDDDLAPHLRPPSWPRIVAVIPARNEAETICATLASLLQQDYPGEFSVVLVDDHSTDATSDLARRVAQEKNAASRLTIRSASELPPGWTGKLWALNEGVTAAAPQTPEFFWFCDADVVHAPDTVHRLVSRA
jgi:glycosyltransferase involved in cell wall biosynthesis